jgi:hypothetical protein
MVSTTTATTKTTTTSSHYGSHSAESYEEAYFYEPGAYMRHLVDLTTSRLQLATTTTTNRTTTTTKRVLLDVGGGTGNFARMLVQATDGGDEELQVVVVDPFLDPSGETSDTSAGAADDDDGTGGAAGGGHTHGGRPRDRSGVSYVRAPAEAFLEPAAVVVVVDDDWRRGYHQVLMKEVVHHLDGRDRVGILRGMRRGMADLVPPVGAVDTRAVPAPPSLLIITRPDVDIDYPLWDAARRVWRDGQPSVEVLRADLEEAGYRDVTHTVEAYPCSIPLVRWQAMVRNRFWSTFSHFSDEELDVACTVIADEYRHRIDEDGNLHFEDRLVFLSACK